MNQKYIPYLAILILAPSDAFAICHPTNSGFQNLIATLFLFGAIFFSLVAIYKLCRFFLLKNDTTARKRQLKSFFILFTVAILLFSASFLPNYRYGSLLGKVFPKRCCTRAEKLRSPTATGYRLTADVYCYCYCHCEAPPQPVELGQKQKGWEYTASHGLPDAQFELGSYYLDESEIKADYATGIRWLRKAATQGHEEAQDILGGEDHRPYIDAVEIKDMLLELAYLGNLKAQHRLANNLRLGRDPYNRPFNFGQPTAYDEAYFWHSVAASHQSCNRDKLSEVQEICAEARTFAFDEGAYLRPEVHRALDERIRQWKPGPVPLEKKQYSYP